MRNCGAEKKTVRHLSLGGFYLLLQDLDAMTYYKKTSTCMLLKFGWSSCKKSCYISRNKHSPPLQALKFAYNMLSWNFLWPLKKAAEVFLGILNGSFFSRFKKGLSRFFWDSEKLPGNDTMSFGAFLHTKVGSQITRHWNDVSEIHLILIQLFRAQTHWKFFS